MDVTSPARVRYSDVLEAARERARLPRTAETQDAERALALKLAAACPFIQRIPDLGARLEAARRYLFSDTPATSVEDTGPGYAFSLHHCPVGAAALEYYDLCAVARAVLAELTGCEIEQSEWIVRGDPRCTFEVRRAPASSSQPTT